MKDMRKGRCPLCSHGEIIEAVAREFAHDSSDATMAVTYDERWMMAGVNVKHGHGTLMIYVCRGCGYAQWFARDPMSIPIGDSHGTRLIKVPNSEGPFR